MSELPVSRESVREEIREAAATFHTLVAAASAEDLRRPSAGTRWTNRQLLFHMMFGYMIVRTLLPLVRMFARVPTPLSRAFARTLNATSRPFHWVNYLGSCVGALVFRGPRLGAQFDRTISAIERRLVRESDAGLASRMHFPVDWDPFFADTMSVLEVYHYGTEHFDSHSRQLTLTTG
ncbi:MAG: DinB family protein [Marmoricola sp.]